MRLTLRQLQVFVAIADHGSTTAAGQAIALSQSASSAALQELEAHFGTPLFDRIGRRLALNGHGRALLEPARTLLVNAADLERQLAAGGDPAQGAPLRLVLAASTTIGNYLLPPRIAELLRQAPQAEVDLRIDNSAGVVAAVQRLDVDAGLIEGPCHERGLQVTAWQEDPLVIVAPPTPPHAGRWTNCAVHAGCCEPGSGTREAVEQALLPHLRGFAQTLQLGNTEAIKQAAIAGLGLAAYRATRWKSRWRWPPARARDPAARPAAHAVAGTPSGQAVAAGIAGVVGGRGVSHQTPSRFHPSTVPAALIHAWRGSIVSTKVDTHQSRMPFRQIAGNCQRRWGGSAGPLAPWMAPSSPMDGFTACPADPYRPAIPQETSF